MLQFTKLLHILQGNKGRWHLELLKDTDDELFTLYGGELAFYHLKKASKEYEVYVIPGELNFVNNVDIKSKISIFTA